MPWYLIAFLIWMAFMLFVIAMLATRMMRFKVRDDRPEYDVFNDSSISDWRRACEKSQAWAIERRNSKRVKNG